jgi:hypothetical protein
VWPTSDGYLLLSDHSSAETFALNLTEFNGAGRPVRSHNLSIAPGWPKSARVTSDGGYLIGSSLTPTSTSWEGRLLKLSADLTVQWAKAFRTGSPSYAHVSGVAETADGGTIALVRDYGRLGIVKLNASGAVEWRKGILPGAETTKATVYDVLENAYLDGDGRKHCGGYILYGGVQRPGTDWDIYLAALACDGSSILWQRIVSGPRWEASHDEGSLFYDDSTNLVVVQERNGVNTQDADLLLVATTDSYGTNRAFLLVPFNVSGGTTLTSPPTFGAIKILDGPDYERAVGPYGGPNLIRLSDGNLLLGGSIYASSSAQAQAFLVKLRPNLDVIWQYTYGAQEEAVGLYESPQSILATGGGLLGLFLRLAPDGTGEGPCVDRSASNLTNSSVSPQISTPAYTLDDGTLQIEDATVTMAEATVDLVCPEFLYLPLLLRSY